MEDLRAQLEVEQGRGSTLEDQLMGKSSARRKTQDDKYKDELKKLEKEKKESKEVEIYHYGFI